MCRFHVVARKSGVTGTVRNPPANTADRRRRRRESTPVAARATITFIQNARCSCGPSSCPVSRVPSLSTLRRVLAAAWTDNPPAVCPSQAHRDRRALMRGRRRRVEGQSVTVRTCCPGRVSLSPPPCAVSPAGREGGRGAQERQLIANRSAFKSDYGHLACRQDAASCGQRMISGHVFLPCRLQAPPPYGMPISRGSRLHPLPAPTSTCCCCCCCPRLSQQQL